MESLGKPQFRAEIRLMRDRCAETGWDAMVEAMVASLAATLRRLLVPSIMFTSLAGALAPPGPGGGAAVAIQVGRLPVLLFLPRTLHEGAAHAPPGVRLANVQVWMWMS